MENPEKMFELMRIDMKQMCENAITELLKVEHTHLIGQEKYVRSAVEDKNYRNSSYNRSFTVKNIGTFDIKVPRDRKGEYSSKLIKKYERYDKALEKNLVLMFLSGLSTRGISFIVSYGEKNPRL